MRRLAVIAVTLLAVTAAGCGGGKSKPTAEDWAGNLCSAVSTWTDSLKSSTTNLQSDPTLDGLKNTKDDVASATDDFTSSLKGLGKPNTESGAKAQDTLDKLASQLDEDEQKLKDEVEGAKGVQGVVAAAKAIQTTLTTMGTQFTAAFTSLQQLDAKGELTDAFTQADSCKKLSGSTS
jgi:hypothetical protein